MTIRRMTTAAPWTAMPGSACHMLKASPESGKGRPGSRRISQGTHEHPYGAAQPCGITSSSGRYGSIFAVLPNFTAIGMGPVFRRLPCQVPNEGIQPFASSPFVHPFVHPFHKATVMPAGDIVQHSLIAKSCAELNFQNFCQFRNGQICFRIG